MKMTGKIFDPKSIKTANDTQSVISDTKVTLPAENKIAGNDSASINKASSNSIKMDSSKLIRSSADRLKREPDIPELLAAIKIMIPLVHKQLENPDFNASKYLDNAISIAHRIGNAAIDDFKATRFVIASLVGSIIDDEILVSKDNEAMIENIIKQIFNRNESELNELIMKLSDAFHAKNHLIQEEASDEDIIRAALLRNSEKIMSDVAHFSFWSSNDEKPEIVKKMVQVIGEVALESIEKINDPKSARSRELMIASIVARTATVVSDCYRTLAFKHAAMSREEKDMVKKAIIRKKARESLYVSVKEMAESKMNDILESAMTFCKTDITMKEVFK